MGSLSRLPYTAITPPFERRAPKSSSKTEAPVLAFVGSLRTFGVWRPRFFKNNLLCRGEHYPSGAAEYTRGLVWDPGGTGSKL